MSNAVTFQSGVKFVSRFFPDCVVQGVGGRLCARRGGGEQQQHFLVSRQNYQGIRGIQDCGHGLLVLHVSEIV